MLSLQFHDYIIRDHVQLGQIPQIIKTFGIYFVNEVAIQSEVIDAWYISKMLFFQFSYLIGVEEPKIKFLRCFDFESNVQLENWRDEREAILEIEQISWQIAERWETISQITLPSQKRISFWPC